MPEISWPFSNLPPPPGRPEGGCLPRSPRRSPWSWLPAQALPGVGSVGFGLFGERRLWWLRSTPSSLVRLMQGQCLPPHSHRAPAVPTPASGPGVGPSAPRGGLQGTPGSPTVLCVLFNLTPKKPWAHRLASGPVPVTSAVAEGVKCAMPASWSCQGLQTHSGPGRAAVGLLGVWVGGTPWTM